MLYKKNEKVKQKEILKQNALKEKYQKVAKIIFGKECFKN